MTATTLPAARPAAPTALTRITNVARLQFANPRTVLVTPLIILGFIFVVNWIIWLLVRLGTGGTEANADVSMGFQYSGASLYVFVYMMVVAIIAMNSTFSLALGLGSTRRDYYLGTALAFIGISALYTVIYTVLAAIEKATNGWGLGGAMFNAVYFGDGPWYAQSFNVFAGFLFFFFVGTIFGAMFVRWKQTGLLLFSALLALIIVGILALITLTDGWKSVGDFFATVGFVGSYALSLILTALAGVAGFFTLSRATPRA